MWLIIISNTVHNFFGLITDKSLVLPSQVYKMICYVCVGGETGGRPILSPGKKLTSQFD